MHDSRLMPYFDPAFGNTPDKGNIPRAHTVRSKLKDNAFVWSKNAGSLFVSGGALIGVKFGVGLLMTGSGFLPLMATTALASGVCSFALQYTMAKMQGKATPKFFSTVGTTAANVATMGLFSIGKTIAQAFNQGSLKALFDWRDPASYLKLGVFAGAAYAGWSIWEEQDGAQALKDIYADTGDGATIEQNDMQTQEIDLPAPNLDGNLPQIEPETGESADNAQSSNKPEGKPSSYGEHAAITSEPDGAQTETEDNATSTQEAGKDDISASGAEDEPVQSESLQNSNDADNTDTTNAQANADDVEMPLDETLSEASALLGENPDQYLQEALERAENGNAQGMKDLAQSLLNGENGAPQDIDTAMALYEHAAEAGSEQAANDLATIQELGTDYFVLEHAEQALEGVESEYVQDAYARAEDGSAQGMKDLAHAFLTGRGDLDQDINRAMQLYEQAAEAGNEQAAEDLQTVEELGAGYFEDQFGASSTDTQPATEETPTKIESAPATSDKIASCTFNESANGGADLDCRYDPDGKFSEDAYASIQIGETTHEIDVNAPEGRSGATVDELTAQERKDVVINQITAPAFERAPLLSMAQPR